MEKRLDRRVRYTLGVIKESFVALLTEKPVTRITVKEICERADINRATFYTHYADQYDLLEKIEAELIEDLVDYLGMKNADFNLASTSADTLERILHYIRENADIIGLLLSPNGDQGFRGKIIDTLRDSVIAEWAQDQGMSQQDADYSFTFVLIGSVGIIQKWLEEGMERFDRDMAELILRLALECHHKEN